MKTPGTAPLVFLPPIILDEERRLEALARYEPSGLGLRHSLDRVAHLAARFFRVPIALVSLVGQDRQRFVGRFGTELEGTPRDISFCRHTIAGNGVLTVPDATKDARFARNPLVTGELGLRFYAGAPLRTPTEHNVGSLCIIDFVARPPIYSSDGAYLAQLAGLAVTYMEIAAQSSDGRSTA